MSSRSEMSEIRAQIRRMNHRLSKTGIDPSNSDRALWGALAIAHFTSVSGPAEGVYTDLEMVLSDLLADLMHLCDVRRSNSELREMTGFESALERARDYYNEELSEELELGGHTQE
jgi:hypothetical protein